jgi:hypothetical protein
MEMRGPYYLGTPHCEGVTPSPIKIYLILKIGRYFFTMIPSDYRAGPRATRSTVGGNLCKRMQKKLDCDFLNSWSSVNPYMSKT